ncbi:hypothetical protein BGW38_003245, partial [Lunasporangiospora selenospora]
MGLKQVRFIDWFKEKFPGSIRTVGYKEFAPFDSVYIDVNCFLHPALRRSNTEHQFVRNLFKTLDLLLARFVPTRICYLSIDGSAPMAKMLLQKTRRAQHGRKVSTGMSTLQLTPGCPFMARVEKYLSYYVVQYLQQRQSQGISPDLKFIVDHSSNPGEGESKIIENVIQQANNIRGRPCAVVSMDSDAVIQAISTSLPNIFVVRYGGPGTLMDVVSIDRTMRELELLFPGESNRVRLDFCAICLLRGNDYLRGIAAGIERLWASYLYTKMGDPEITTRSAPSYLIDAQYKTFDLVFLRQMILNSYKSPANLLLTEGAYQHRQFQRQKEVLRKVEMKNEANPGTAEDPFSDDRNWNQSDSEEENDKKNGGDGEDGKESDSEEREESNEEDENNENVVGWVPQFLNGILWNIEMYCTGTCPDVSFAYSYQHAPPRRQLISYINALAETSEHHKLLPSSTHKLLHVPTSPRQYLQPLICALVLLPAGSGTQFLPPSIASIHTSIVPEDCINPTQDDLDVYDQKVQGLIEILDTSEKASDVLIAKELSYYYLTRSPFMWTRLRTTENHRTPAPMPLSPLVVIAQSTQGVNLPTGAATPSAPDSGERLGELENQRDIVCRNVNPPNKPVRDPQTGLTHSNASQQQTRDQAPWTTPERQNALSTSVKKSTPGWPFILGYRKNYKGPLRVYNPVTTVPEPRKQTWNKAHVPAASPALNKVMNSFGVLAIDSESDVVSEELEEKQVEEPLVSMASETKATPTYKPRKA